MRLEGEVRILNDLAGVTATLFAEAAALRVEGTNGDVVGQWNGIDSFAIDGVKSAAAVWAQVTPGPGDALIGLGPVDTSSPDDSGVVTTVLAVARASDFREAFDLLSSPIALDEAAAQAILIAQTNNAAVAGVRVVAPLDRTVLYVENGAFTDTATSTDASGRFMLANVPAGDWPGNTVTLTLDGPVSGRYDLKVVSGGMTLGKVGN